MPQSAKQALLHILYDQTLTDEILITAFVQAANLLNNRPLSRVSDDPAYLEPLTPHYLLFGRANPNIPPDV